MPTTPPAGIRLSELAALAGAALDGDGEIRVSHVATLEGAGDGAIAFLSNPRYRPQLGTTRACAVIVSPADAAATSLPKLVTPNPYAAYARVASALHPAPPLVPGIHPSAVIDASATVAADAQVGALAAIGARTVVGARAMVGPGCVIGDDVVLADDVRLVARVTVYSGCRIGARTIVHGGAVIGADGFGMAEEAGRWIKIPQIGGVVIGADCEIGANTTIDRGAIDDTVIEDDVKLDNQIQVGHNTFIGRHTAIAGCVGISGSARIGRDCKIGGAAGVGGHIEIADGVTVGGMTPVVDSIRAPGVYTGMFPMMSHREWQQVAVELRHLRETAKAVRALARRIDRQRDHESEDGK
jgi:UDP-3-O-[3-hydroxymyristoyl] glucosamine N-acyltransferase